MNGPESFPAAQRRHLGETPPQEEKRDIGYWRRTDCNAELAAQDAPRTVGDVGRRCRCAGCVMPGPMIVIVDGGRVSPSRSGGRGAISIPADTT